MPILCSAYFLQMSSLAVIPSMHNFLSCLIELVSILIENNVKF